MKLRKKRCHCGWKYPGFHICIDLSKPLDPQIIHKLKITPSHQRSLEEGRAARWERHRDEMFKRDQKIVQRYKEGASYKTLAEEFGIANATVMGIIHRAKDRGEVEIHPVGGNLRWRKESAS